jgi:hypothetical protein
MEWNQCAKDDVTRGHFKIQTTEAELISGLDVHMK